MGAARLGRFLTNSPGRVSPAARRSAARAGPQEQPGGGVRPGGARRAWVNNSACGKLSRAEAPDVRAAKGQEGNQNCLPEKRRGVADEDWEGDCAAFAEEAVDWPSGRWW